MEIPDSEIIHCMLSYDPKPHTGQGSAQLDGAFKRKIPITDTKASPISYAILLNHNRFSHKVHIPKRQVSVQ